jgi:hypothetical protein
MARAITFRGVDAVMEAYELNQMGPWAVLSQGKIVCSSRDVGDDDIDQGTDQLEGFLGLMKKHGSQAVYELQVYRLGTGNVEINSKTPYSRSVPFSLFENPEPSLSNQDNRIFTLLTEMQLQIKALQEQAAAREVEMQDDDGPEDDGTVMGKIGSMAMGILERPDVQQAIAVGAVNFVKKFVPNMGSRNGTAEAEGRRVAGVETGYVNLLDQAQISKVHAAITRLSAKDAHLGDHLEKLADIAENQPGKYTMALNFL